MVRLIPPHPELLRLVPFLDPYLPGTDHRINLTAAHPSDQGQGTGSQYRLIFLSVSHREIMKIKSEKANEMLGMVSKATIEGKKQKDQGTHILKLWTHVRIESTTGEEKMLRKWRAAGQRNSLYESICT